MKRRLNNIKAENLALMVLTLMLMAGGYIFLRYAYHVADHLPFSQEVVLVLLGTLITIFITALLLNKQTSVELMKEENIKFLELKADIYFELINHLEQVLLTGSVGREARIHLRILASKLAIIASSAVLEQFEQLIRVFSEISSDQTIVDIEGNRLMHQLALLTVSMRADLVGELDDREGITQAWLSKQILLNNDRLDMGT